MIGGFQPLAFQPAYQQVGSVGTPYYSGGWTDLPTGKRKTKKQLREEREKWGVIPKQAKVIIKRVAAQQYEAPDNTEALIAAFGRAELVYKTQYAALYRMEVERQLAMMREEEEFILLH